MSYFLPMLITGEVQVRSIGPGALLLPLINYEQENNIYDTFYIIFRNSHYFTLL